MGNDSGPVRGRRRGPAWTKVDHGLYRPSTELSGLDQDLQAWRLVLPESAGFTHLTAAHKHGWWLPPLPQGLPVFVSMNDADTRPKRAALVVSRHKETPQRIIKDDLPIAAPAETLLACARDLQLLDLVVLIDAALHMGSCTVADLEAAAASRRRGAPMLRRALRHADGRAESAWESMLRMLHIVCEIPVEPQYDVYDGHGLFVARGDLWIKGTTTLHDYDGGEHLKRRRQRKDLGRARRLGHVAWTRRGYTSHEVLMQAVASCATPTHPWAARTGRTRSGPGMRCCPSRCSRPAAPSSSVAGGVCRPAPPRRRQPPTAFRNWWRSAVSGRT